MNNRLFHAVASGVVIVAVLAVLFGVAVQPGLADGGAVVLHGFTCRLNPAESGLPVALETRQTQTVLTPSGNTIVKCNFDVPAEYAPAAPTLTEGFTCVTLAGTTNASRLLLTPSGQGFLTCEINGSTASPASVPDGITQ
jgi:hypothetical protein